MIITVQSAWEGFIDFDNRQEIFTGYQDFILTIDNTGQINTPEIKEETKQSIISQTKNQFSREGIHLPPQMLLKLGSHREQLLYGCLLFGISPLSAIGVQSQFGDIGWSGQTYGRKQIVQHTLTTRITIFAII